MKKTLYTGVILLIFTLLSFEAYSQIYSQDGFAHTYSIVARDAETGEMGVGVQSHWFSVGSVVVWGKSGVGVVATQSFVNPAYGPNGLAMMEARNSASHTLETLVEEDIGRDFRQVAMLDANGDVAAYTGAKCIVSADHIVGENYSVQANMMLNDKIVPAMSKAFEGSEGLPLEERILLALHAAQAEGGDIRGKQSAAMIVVHGQKAVGPWAENKIDLRVDDHVQPLLELERLLQVHQAYEHMNKGDLAVEAGDMKLALEEYGSAEELFPGNLEMKYWKAVALSNNDNVEMALPIFKEIFTKDENWRELTKRLPRSGLLTVDEEDYEKILEQ